jgi:hypothetical protein
MELSILDDLKGELDEYIQRYLPAKVKVIRNMKREGLIRGRMIGAAHATGISTLWLCGAGHLQRYTESHTRRATVLLLRRDTMYKAT